MHMTFLPLLGQQLYQPEYNGKVRWVIIHHHIHQTFNIRFYATIYSVLIGILDSHAILDVLL